MEQYREECIKFANWLCHQVVGGRNNEQMWEVYVSDDVRRLVKYNDDIKLKVLKARRHGR